ncbi:helix-turn-helix domain-containing protein [Acetobacteroides hydrogenigenes]|uniref:AraC-like DNA-binding protein n=1 Tax=Acetobacteroides hydrogenigenes TaxID=979970 RepID=A0A4R2E837_9BACT|nr:AraC family transcriptional regulator [Acetobacteroides hydrogenigenes]TCN64748.1 AraC-like DNA-binding protein [Acetobacteroides hydrogenigenes]
MEQLNIVSIALLSFFFVSFISKKGKTLSENILIFWLGVLIVSQITYLIEKSVLIHRFHFVVESICSINIIHGATLLVYVKSMIDKDYRIGRTELIHLTPFVILIAAKLLMQDVWNLYSCAAEGSCTCSNNIYLRLISWYKILVVGAYVIYSLTLYLKAKKSDSYLLGLSTQTKWWITTVVLGSVTLFGLIVALELVQVLSIYQITDKLLVINILTSIFAILFIYIGNKYAFLLSKVSNSVEKPKRKNSTTPTVQNDESLIDPKFERIFNEVEQLMKEQQLYLEPELTLSMVSERIKVPSAIVSQAVKIFTNQSFPSYINTYRVDMVIEKMNSPLFKTYTILSLALESGFNSKASFNRIFKQQKGVTPSEYATQLGLSPKEE